MIDMRGKRCLPSQISQRMLPGHVVQFVARGPGFNPSTESVVSNWEKYVQFVLVNRLGGVSLPRNSVVRLIVCPDMTIVVYCGRKATK